MKKTLALLLTFLALTALTACFQVYDGPPKDDGTPAPPAHNGVFTSDHGTMTFNGDGKSVTLSLDGYLADLTGLPEGEAEASYIFFANFPPHRTDYRYDRADELDITAGDVTYTFKNRIGATDKDAIRLYLYDNSDGTVEVDFYKEV